MPTIAVFFNFRSLLSHLDIFQKHLFSYRSGRLRSIHFIIRSRLLPSRHHPDLSFPALDLVIFLEELAFGAAGIRLEPDLEPRAVILSPPAFVDGEVHGGKELFVRIARPAWDAVRIHFQPFS